MNKTFVSIAAAALSTAAIFASPAAYAADAAIRIGDLDLATPAGQATLARRVDAAAHEACDGVVTGSRIDHGTECRAQVKQQVAARLQARGQRVALSH